VLTSRITCSSSKPSRSIHFPPAYIQFTQGRQPLTFKVLRMRSLTRRGISNASSKKEQRNPRLVHVANVGARELTSRYAMIGDDQRTLPYCSASL